MKKFKKMLAGLLGAAMVLTSFGTPAWAESKVDTPQKTTATIDTKKTGSITIHKYEYNGNTTLLPDGTGETTDASQVPSSDAKPLAGAGFTIYQIANVDDLTDYYSTNPSELPNVDSYVEQNATTKKWSIKSDVTASRRKQIIMV